MTDKLKMVMFYSSVRDGRMNERVGKFVKKTIEDNGMDVTVFDPKHMEFELLKQPLHFRRNQNDAPTWLRDANEVIKNADGFFIVSAEYNCGVPPALSNMLDHFSPNSFRHRPCGVVTYSMGSFGGSCVSVVLMPMICELGMLTVPSPVTVPKVSETFGDQGECKSDRVGGNISHLVKLTKWFASGIRAQRKAADPPIKS